MISEPITWTNETRRIGELIEWDHNPRYIERDHARRLEESLDEFGQIHAIVIGPDNEIYDGNQRRMVWAAIDDYGPDFVVDVRVSSRSLTERERRKLIAYLHRGTTGNWDMGALVEWDMDDLIAWGFEEWEFGDHNEIEKPSDPEELADDPGDPDDSDERESWPEIRVQVSPDTYDLYQSLRSQISHDDDAYKMQRILEAVDENLLGEDEV